MSDEHALDGESAAAENEFAERLTRGRPLPAAGFRGALGRHLTARDPGYGPRPRQLWMMVAGYAGAGAVLILAGVVQATS